MDDSLIELTMARSQTRHRMWLAQFGEAGGCEVAVEGERLLEALGAHEGEAGRVDERVLALVVRPQPAQGLVSGASLSSRTPP